MRELGTRGARRAAVLRVSLVAAVLGLACESPAPPEDAGADASADTCSSAPTADLDVLFVVETGGYVSGLQLTTTQELPRWLARLFAGDAPLASVQLGVVTTDMGTLGQPLPTCVEPLLGDDALLRTEADPGHGILDPLPAIHTATDREDLEETVRTLSLAIETGNDAGCGIEQPLEAMLKALSPAAPTTWTRDGYVPPRFFRGEGHGDGANAGLVRDESVLLVVILMSEDDASAADPAFFDLMAFPEAHAAWPYLYPQLVHPVSRYVEGLLALRRDPSRLVVALIAGFPTNAVEAPGEVDLDALVRDPRMEILIDPALPSRIGLVCQHPGRVPAGFPALRLLTMGAELRRAGAHVIAGSICADDYAPVFGALVGAVARARVGTPCADE